MGCHWNLFLSLDLAAICTFLCSGLPLHKNVQIKCTQYKTHKFPRGRVQWLCLAQKCAVASHCTATAQKFPEFVAKCWILCALEEFLCTCKKTVQVPFPTLTGKSHTTGKKTVSVPSKLLILQAHIFTHNNTPQPHTPPHKKTHKMKCASASSSAASAAAIWSAYRAPLGATPWPIKMPPLATTATMGLRWRAGDDSLAITPARRRRLPSHAQT